MKKIIAIMMAMAMLLAFTACGAEKEETKNEETKDTVVENNDTTAPEKEESSDATVGETLKAEFKANADKSAQEIADAVLANSMVQFMPASMPVEEGFLNGFNDEIKGFKEGIMFGPAIGTIPFVGYVFVLEDGADVDAFKTTLSDNANLRWNICTQAEEMVIESEGNTVFFLMCPSTFEEESAGDEMDMGMDMDMGLDMEIPAEDGIAAEEGIILG